MKKPHLNGVNVIENNFSLDSDIKDRLLSEAKQYFVSFFNSVTDKNPREISITEALTYINSEKFLITINKIRNSELKAERDVLKKTLPCISVSGIFKNGHSSKDIIKHSGLIQVDIDDVDNPEILKERISGDCFTYSCFISPSGNGVKVIIKIPNESHSESFEMVNNYFSTTYEIQIDAKCKDIGRLMYLSYDSEIFINENSLVMNKTTLEVKKIISEIESRSIDITEPYENWLKIGFAFANEFNESGRALYHLVSRVNSKYNEKDCNDQFSNCLKSQTNKTTIKSFFYLAKEKGIKLRSVPENSLTKPIDEEPKKNDANETSRFKIVEEYLNKKFEFRYNKVANEIEHKEIGETEFTSLNDNNLYRHLQLRNINFSMNNLNALLRSDFVKEYDPVEYYFESLNKWDEQTDHVLNLCSFIKAKDQERFNRHFKKMLVRCVACGLGKSFNKQAFIFMGGQSSGKTTFCRWLCPDMLKPYYAENINTDKDSQISLTENFMISLDELASMPKMDVNALKSMLSKDRVKIRRPYDKKPSIAKRRANFFGSTNKDEFLNDETGSVRWLCFEILEFIWAYKQEIDVNLVWGQAYTLYKKGFHFELTSEETDENEKFNSNHTIRTAEMELIQRYYEPIEKGKVFAKHYTATDIINELKSKGLAQINLTNINIGKAMRQLGYVSVSERVGENKMAIKGYWLFLKFQDPPTTPTTNL